MRQEIKTTGRDLSVKEKFSISKFLVSWEMMLVYILILINLVLIIARPGLYFTRGTIQSIIQSGMDVSPLVLGMIFVLMLGDIDVSIASIMIFASMATGLSMDSGLPVLICVLIGILAGGLCGAFNGFLIAYMKMPAVIVTISTSMVFRGIVKIILDVNVLKNFPAFYTYLAWNNILGIPISLICFLLLAVVFLVVLHKSEFGRKLYIIGNNSICANYSGISVEHTKMIVFIVMGIMAGIASIFFVGRMGGGVSSTMGTGYEMDAIAICVLGGISTNGGKGKVYGPVIATLIIAFLTYTLGLVGIDANTRKILTGVILIIAVLIPSVNKQLISNIRRRLLYANSKNIESVNLKACEEIKVIKRMILEVQKDASLSDADRETKVNKYQEKVKSIQKKCREQTATLKAEEKIERKKEKERKNKNERIA